MKRRLAALMLMLLPFALSTAGAQEIGAYFTLVNTYIYAKGPREGRRVLVRPRQAFNVLDVTTDHEDTMWFLIVHPRETSKFSGTGWTAQAPHELVSARQEPVLLFSRIPDGTGRDLSIYRIPATAVELLNETQSDTPFSQLDWQKVRFQFDQPLRAWARGTAGIYRPGKTAGFLSRVYGELVTRNVDKDEQVRLLSGVVHVGDDVREVRWALGDALRSQEETIGDAHRTLWQYPEMTVTFENDVVKQIN